jgi:Fic family protein
MEIDVLLKQIDSLRSQISQTELTTKDLLKLAFHFRLDWGIESEEQFSEEYTGGSTMQIIMKGIANNEQLASNQGYLSDNNVIDKLLNDFFDNPELNIDRLCEIHKLIIKEGGNFRTTEVAISNEPKREYIFSKVKNINVDLQELINWYNQNKNNPSLHPVLLAAGFHYRFVLIHPFLDGNGRIARILSSLTLLKNKIPPPVIKKEDRPKYIEYLIQADSGEIEPWFIFISKKTILSLESILSKNYKR